MKLDVIFQGGKLHMHAGRVSLEFSLRDPVRVTVQGELYQIAEGPALAYARKFGRPRPRLVATDELVSKERV